MTLDPARLWTLCALSALCLGGCGDNSSETGTDTGTGTDIGADAGGDDATGSSDVRGDTASSDTTSGDIEAAPRGPVVPAQGSSCVLDIDCAPDRFCFLGSCSIECDDADPCADGETCSDRGRCVIADATKSLDGQDEAAAPERVEGDLRFDEIPARVQRVAPGEDEITLVATLTGTAPEAGISYRIETADGDTQAEVHRATAFGTEVEFTLPTGAADPLSDEPALVEVNVVSSLGSFRVSMIPTPPVAGLYSGEARVEQFGNMGVPIELMIVTDPPDASLEDADYAWLVLPIREDRILSPREPAGAADEPQWMARPLVYDRFIERWVARFENEFRFASDSLLGSKEPGQVGRSIRVELTPGEERTLVGAFIDSWTGLYDSRNDAGVLEGGVVTFMADFEVLRMGAALDRAEFEEAPLQPVSPERIPLPPLDVCDSSMLAVDPITVDGTAYDCADINTLTQFAAASAEDRAACAIAVVENALAGDTTIDLLTQFLDGTSPGDESFADFMERCANGTGGACRPSDDTLCGRQLVAYAYVAQAADVSSSAQLVSSFQDATREAFLGRQLGAFQTDSNKRLDWLRTSDYPAIVTTAVVDRSTSLLNEWVAGVLDVHFEVLAGQFDASGLAVLARQPVAEDSMERRRELLFEMTQGWRATMESLTLATQRWNTLYQDAESRRERTQYVAARMVDLYVLAGLAGNLNQSAGAGFANAAFGGGYAALNRELNKLALPFSELIYARDAEVVVSTSLDPQSSNNTVLRELQTAARAEITTAAASVQDVIDEANVRALSEAQLRNQLDNDLREARGDLVELCGVPVGCSAGDYPAEEDCAVRVEAGECGFAIDRYTGELQDYAGQPVVTSDAGRAMMAVLDATNNYNITESEFNAHVARVNRAYDDVEVFKATIDGWHERRLSTLEEVDRIIADRATEWDAALAELTASIDERASLRAGAIESARESQERWEEVEDDANRVRMISTVQINGVQTLAQWQRSEAAEAIQLGQIAKEGFPTVVGTSNDTSSVGRVTVLMAAMAKAKTHSMLATASDIAAKVLQKASDWAQRQYSLEIRDIQQEAEFEQREATDAIAQLEDMAQRIEIEQGVRDASVDRLIDAMRANMEYELAYERDMIEFMDRRSEAWGMIQNNATLLLRVVEAQFDIEQRVFEYLEVVQRAELLKSRIDELENQQQNISLLLGSPAIVFAWANRLQQAELRLERAKSALMDWLVAMEYFAVRPFMDQRIQILLARNTYQLDAIADEMARLQGACGGAQNPQSSTVSLASVLGLTSEVIDPSSETIYSPGERLRAVLSRGVVPIDTRTRYTSGETIGELLGRTSVWSATFSIDLNSFANLASTCNARISSMKVQLVGDELLFGEDTVQQQPTVTILYDGTSQLRSCQPGVSEYVDLFGPEATSFDEITTFRTPSRGVSPVAGINEFSSLPGDGSLGGLPLSSQYTILIDLQESENRSVNWDNVEDVLLQVEYEYQNLFPIGQCE